MPESQKLLRPCLRHKPHVLVSPNRLEDFGSEIIAPDIYTGIDRAEKPLADPTPPIV